MSKINDGGPAFPSEYVDYAADEIGNDVPIFARSSGLTIRDWFAGQAMQARLTGLSLPRLDIRNAIAADAYAIADAMLAEREKAGHP